LRLKAVPRPLRGNYTTFLGKYAKQSGERLKLF
jgi:hypothetical protein